MAQCLPNLLATASYDGEVIVWNLVSGHIFCHLNPPAPPGYKDESRKLCLWFLYFENLKNTHYWYIHTNGLFLLYPMWMALIIVIAPSLLLCCQTIIYIPFAQWRLEVVHKLCHALEKGGGGVTDLWGWDGGMYRNVKSHQQNAQNVKITKAQPTKKNVSMGFEPRLLRLQILIATP